MLEVMLLGVAAFLMIFDVHYRDQWFLVFDALSRVAKGLLGFFFFMGVLSASLADFPKHGFQEVFLLALLYVFAVGIAAQIRLHGEQAIFFVILAIFVSIILITIFLINVYIDRFSLADQSLVPFGFFRFANVRFFNHFQTWTLPLLALPFLYWSGRLGYWKVILFLPSSFWWAWWIFSGGRGTLLSMLLGSLAVWFFFRDHAYPWLRFQVRALFWGWVIYVMMFHIIVPESGMITLAREPDEARLLLWAAALRMSAEHPLLGIAPQHYAFLHPVALLAHPHNAFFQVLAEWGIPAFLAFCLLIFSGFRSWIRTALHAHPEQQAASQNRHHTLVALTCSAVGGLVHAQVCGILVMPFSQVMGVIVMGLMIALHQDALPTAPVPMVQTSWQKSIGFIGAHVVLISVLVWTLFPEVTHLEENRMNYFQHFPEETNMHPRFWRQGLIGF
ncbi:MAG: O-antigen ligase family protein [Magnetococcus sp. YQC-5]